MKPTYNKAEVTSLFDIEQARLLPSASEMRKLTMILTTNYRDKFIFIQELLSNAIDAHIEVGQGQPCRLGITKVNDEYEVCITDFGPGLNPERAKMVYTFLKSTKEDTDRQVGGYGLGSKSPFAYTNYFFVESVVENVSYTYLVSLSDGFITLSLVNQQDKVAPNQTHIKVYIKEKDIDKALNTLKKRCAYFTNVHYYGEASFMNNNTVVRETKFVINQYHRKLHLVIGPVAYPIDLEQVPSVSKYYDMNIGLKFGVDEIQPIPTREDIPYTQEYIKLIELRLGEAITRLNDYKEKQKVKTTNVKEYSKQFVLKNVIKLGNSDVNIKPIGGKDIKFTPLECTSPSNLWDVIKKHIVFHKVGHNLRLRTTSGYIRDNFVYASASTSTPRNRYCRKQNLVVCRPKLDTPTYIQYNKTRLESFEKERQAVQSYFEKYIEKYEDLPEIHVEKVKKVKDKEKISCKVSSTMVDYTLDELKAMPCVVIGRKKNKT